MQTRWLVFVAVFIALASSVSALTLLDGVTHAWHFDQNSTDFAGSMSGSDVNISYVLAKILNGAYFNGLAYIGLSPQSIPYDYNASNKSNSNTKSYSYNVWIYYNDSSNSQGLYSTDGGGTVRLMLNNQSTGSVSTYRWTNTGLFRVTATGLVTGNWYMFTTIYDSATLTLKLYVNGVSSGSVFSDGQTNGIGNGIIGGYKTSFYGIADEFVIWDRALDDSNVSYLYNVGSPTFNQTYPYPFTEFVPNSNVKSFSDQIVFWSDLSEGSGTPVDLTGHISNVSWLGDAGYSSSSKPTAFNYSLRVNATSAAQSAGLVLRSSLFDDFFSGSESRGVCAWINTGAANAVQGIAEYRVSNTIPYSTFGVYKSATGNVNARSANFGSYNASFMSGNSLFQNKSSNQVTNYGNFGSTWYHVCVLFTNANSTIETTGANSPGQYPMRTDIWVNGAYYSTSTNKNQPIHYDDVIGGNFTFGTALSNIVVPVVESAKNIAQPIVFKFSSKIPMKEIEQCLYNGGSGITYDNFMSSLNACHGAVVLIKPGLNVNGSSLVANYSELWSPANTGIDATTFRWFVNGSEVGGQTTNVLSSLYWSGSDVVTVEFTPSDSVVTGLPLNVSYPFNAELIFVNGSTLRGLQLSGLRDVQFPHPQDTRVLFYMDGFYSLLFGQNYFDFDRYTDSLNNSYSSGMQWETSPSLLDTSLYPQMWHRIGVAIVDDFTGVVLKKEVSVLFNNTGNSTSQYGTGGNTYIPGYSYPRINASLFARYKGEAYASVPGGFLSDLAQNGTGGVFELNFANSIPFEWQEGYLNDRRSVGAVPLLAGSDIQNLTSSNCKLGNCIGFIGTANSKANASVGTAVRIQNTIGTNYAQYSLWFYPNETSQMRTIMSSITGAWQLRIAGVDNLTPEFRVSSDSFNLGNASAIPNAWNHIYVFNNATYKRVWLNGQEVISSPAVGAAAVNLIFGQNGVNTSNVFSGRIDEYAAWSGATDSWVFAETTACNGRGFQYNCTMNIPLIAQTLYNGGQGIFTSTGFEGVLTNDSSAAYLTLTDEFLTPGQNITATGPRMSGAVFSYAYDAQGRLVNTGTSATPPFTSGFLRNIPDSGTYSFLNGTPYLTQKVTYPFWNTTTDGPLPNAFRNNMTYAAVYTLCERLSNGSTVAWCTNPMDTGAQYIFNFTTATTPETTYVTDIASICQGLVYPNEKDLPAPQNIQFNFTVSVFPDFNGESYYAAIQRVGDAAKVAACSYTVVNSTERNYVCNVTMNYYVKPGSYTILINFTNYALTQNYTNTGVCSYGQLLAMQKTTPGLTFVGAGPGINNIQSSNVITLENTGNVDFTMFLTGKDLTGRTSPSVKLPASAFKVGKTLGSTVALLNSVAANTTIFISAGSGSNDSVYLWLSMPANTLPQDYYSQDSWEIAGTS